MVRPQLVTQGWTGGIPIHNTVRMYSIVKLGVFSPSDTGQQPERSG